MEVGKPSRPSLPPVSAFGHSGSRGREKPVADSFQPPCEATMQRADSTICFTTIKAWTTRCLLPTCVGPLPAPLPPPPVPTPPLPAGVQRAECIGGEPVALAQLCAITREVTVGGSPPGAPDPRAAAEREREGEQERQAAAAGHCVTTLKAPCSESPLSPTTCPPCSLSLAENLSPRCMCMCGACSEGVCLHASLHRAAPRAVSPSEPSPCQSPPDSASSST